MDRWEGLVNGTFRLVSRITCHLSRCLRTCGKLQTKNQIGNQYHASVMIPAVNLNIIVLYQKGQISDIPLSSSLIKRKIEKWTNTHTNYKGFCKRQVYTSEKLVDKAGIMWDDSIRSFKLFSVRASCLPTWLQHKE